MAKTDYPPAQPLPVVTTNATSAGPGYVPTITLDAGYRAKTKLVTIILDGDGVLRKRVYRESGKASGLYSCDVHEQRNGVWIAAGKEDWKTHLPAPPPGAKLTIIEEVPFWAFQEMSEEDIARHRQELLATR
jgi:hypothetical protein